MMKKPILLFQICLFLSAFQLQAALVSKDLNPSLNTLMVKIGEPEFKSIDEFKVSVNDTTDFSQYDQHDMEFTIDAPIENVWKAYTQTRLNEMWNSEKFEFGFAYSKTSQKIYYSKDAMPMPEVGMGFYLVLKPFLNVKLPVGLEISKLDQEHHLFSYVYLDKGQTIGKQEITLTSISSNQTTLRHFTTYHSKSYIRGLLYGPVHAYLITKFHESVAARSGFQITRTK